MDVRHWCRSLEGPSGDGVVQLWNQELWWAECAGVKFRAGGSKVMIGWWFVSWWGLGLEVGGGVGLGI